MSSLTWVAGDKTPRSILFTRVWNFGTLDEWQRMWRDYLRSEIEAVARRPLRGEWTRHGKAFAETVLDITMPDDCLISYLA